MANTAYFYFDVLPVHPRPERLESFNGYLTRLAAANGIRSRNSLTVLFFPGSNTTAIRVMKDCPPASFGALPAIAACSESVLRATTFCHLGEKFGRSTQPPRLAMFLNGSLAQRLRYCPACLAEYSYHLLPWRFLILEGCSDHHCKLMDHCGHCGRQIPLLAAPFRVDVCPWCDGDLRVYQTQPLDGKDLRVAQARYGDLEFLLSPQAWTVTGDETARSIGQRFAQCRQTMRLSRTRIAALTGLKPDAIYAIEFGAEGRGGKSFQDYVRYADGLGVTLRDLFSIVLQPEANGDSNDDSEATLKQVPKKRDLRPLQEREEELLGRVQEAMRGLETEDRLTLEAIGKIVGMTPGGLKYYPKVKALLKQVTAYRATGTRRNEEELVGEVRTTIEWLKTRKELVTQVAVARAIGMSLERLMRYPEVKAIFRQIAEERRRSRKRQFQLHEDDLVRKVQKAIKALEA